MSAVSTAAMVADARLRRFFAHVGALLADGVSTDPAMDDALCEDLLELAPEYVPPFGADPHDRHAWCELLVDADPALADHPTVKGLPT